MNDHDRRRNDVVRNRVIVGLFVLLGVMAVSSWMFSYMVWEAAKVTKDEAALAKVEASIAAKSTAINRAISCFLIVELKAAQLLKHDHPLCDDLDFQRATAPTVSPPAP